MPAEPASRFRPTAYTAAWIFWAAFFLIVEGLALRSRRKQDTFSEHWWALFRVRQRTSKPVKAGLLVLQLGVGVWLVGHLAFGIWTF